jgi:hypothetical protein
MMKNRAVEAIAIGSPGRDVSLNFYMNFSFISLNSNLIAQISKVTNFV